MSSTRDTVDVLKDLIEMTPTMEEAVRKICEEPRLLCPRCSAGALELHNGHLCCATCLAAWEASVAH